MTKRTAFFISGSTGLTAEALGNSLLSQFEQIEFETITLPFVDSLEKADEALELIAEHGRRDGKRPLIFDTIADPDIRARLDQSDSMQINLFSAFIKPLEEELGHLSSHSIGKSHRISAMTRYKDRIDAINYTLNNDDGAQTRYYDQADIILLGVSRSGKTPTCLYMAMQFGLRAANFPLTDDDLNEQHKLPEVLEPYRDKLFGLTIDTFHLAAIRHERQPNSRYASLNQCEWEVNQAERMLRNEQIPLINTTQFSVEEIATRIIAQAGLQRRIN